MDSVQRMEVASKGVAAGILSPNDGRARHNLKPAKGGDEPRMQQQYVPLSDALAPKPAPVVPGLVPEPKPPVVPPVKSLDDGFLEEVLRAYETVEVA
jgi:hypothetical protein